MSASRKVGLTSVLVGVGALIATACSPVARMSTDSLSVEGDDESQSSDVSADGRYVVFESWATNLVPGVTNDLGDVYRKDAVSGAITRVSTDGGGAESDGDSGNSAISSDGMRVAFESDATNLVADDLNDVFDVFVKDMASGATTRVSTDGAGGEADDASHFAAISGDGLAVAFASSATNLVAGDGNGVEDVFVKDTVSGAVTRVSTDSLGTEADGWSASSALSANGRHVAFYSVATNLVAGDGNGVGDVFLKDTVTGGTTRVSTDSLGGEANGGAGGRASISADGRYVAFSSDASNLVAGDTNGSFDIFVKDTLTGVTMRVSTDGAGVEGNFHSWSPSVSDDGRFVAFESYADNFVAGDDNGTLDVYVKDTVSGAISRVSVPGPGAEADDDVVDPTISGGGSHVVFESYATNLVAGDTNGVVDVFRVARS